MRWGVRLKLWNGIWVGFGPQVASGAQYNAAGQMTGLTYGLSGVSWTETNAFNALGQLTRKTIPTVVDFEYTFSATANNGQITTQKDWITGDEQNYQYDALKRLTMAWTTGPAYGLSFGYDGFGNKLSQTVTKGSAPASSITVDANNRIVGQSYDANGNMTSGASSTLTYDVDNRVITAAGLSSEQYSYNPSNKRVWKKRATGGGNFAEDVYFYGIDGQRQATFTLQSGAYWVLKSADIRFAGKLLYTNNAWVATDRLGSIRYRKPTGAGERLDFFPYGEERPSSTAQDRDKFATYMRDDTGLDYADQRYFTNTSGRFVTPDPAGDGSNWYAYAGGDPANNFDPTGLECSPAQLMFGNCVDVTAPHPGPLPSGSPGGGGGGQNCSDVYSCPDVAIAGEQARIEVELGLQTAQHHANLQATIHSQGALAVDSIAPECQTQLDDYHIKSSDIKWTISQTTYYSVFDYGNTLASEIYGPAVSGTVAQLVGESRAATVAIDGQATYKTVLGSQYFYDQGGFGDSIATSQGATIIHEALHTIFAASSHEQIAERIGVKPEGMSASAAISTFFAKCIK
jgi:RHS repeat-associated protein